MLELFRMKEIRNKNICRDERLCANLTCRCTPSTNCRRSIRVGLDRWLPPDCIPMLRITSSNTCVLLIWLWREEVSLFSVYPPRAIFGHPARRMKQADDVKNWWFVNKCIHAAHFFTRLDRHWCAGTSDSLNQLEMNKKLSLLDHLDQSRTQELITFNQNCPRLCYLEYYSSRWEDGVLKFLTIIHFYCLWDEHEYSNLLYK